jgi:hypothetical protein
MQIGERLAAGAWATAYGHTSAPASGPVIAGCALSASADEITLFFNKTLLRSDRIFFKGCYKQNTTGGLAACATQVHRTLSLSLAPSRCAAYLHCTLHFILCAVD